MSGLVIDYSGQSWTEWFKRVESCLALKSIFTFGSRARSFDMIWESNMRSSGQKRSESYLDFIVRSIWYSNIYPSKSGTEIITY